MNDILHSAVVGVPGVCVPLSPNSFTFMQSLVVGSVELLKRAVPFDDDFKISYVVS